MTYYQCKLIVVIDNNVNKCCLAELTMFKPGSHGRQNWTTMLRVQSIELTDRVTIVALPGDQLYDNQLRNNLSAHALLDVSCRCSKAIDILNFKMSMSKAHDISFDDDVVFYLITDSNTDFNQKKTNKKSTARRVARCRRYAPPLLVAAHHPLTEVRDSGVDLHQLVFAHVARADVVPAAAAAARQVPLAGGRRAAQADVVTSGAVVAPSAAARAAVATAVRAAVRAARRAAAAAVLWRRRVSARLDLRQRSAAAAAATAAAS